MIKLFLETTLNDGINTLSSTKYWISELKCGRASIFDEDRAYRPNKVNTSERVKKIHDVVKTDWRMKECERNFVPSYLMMKKNLS